jgi:hypothetical protein
MGLAERAALVATVGIVLFGLALRARGYLFGGHPLWLDECAWAVYLIQHRHGDDNLRPIGFMAVTHLFAVIASPSERVLRALPWACGVVSTLVSPALARRLFDGRAARLMFVAIVALHPAAIDLTKEFKPYSVSLTLHVLLLFGTLRYATSLRSRDLAFSLLVAGVGQLFAQDMVFAYPGAFLVLGWEAFRRQKTHLYWVLGCALAIVLGLAAQYYFIWRNIPATESTYWGNKYGVFHLPTSPQSYLAWAWERYRGLAEFPGHRRRFWRSEAFSGAGLEHLRYLDVALWTVAHALGLVVLVTRRKYRVLLLTMLPIGVLWAFNALQFWPLGVFRTNLFSLVYMSVVAAAAFDGLPALRARWVSLVPASVLVVAPLLLFEQDWHARKRAFAYDGHFPDVLRDLQETIRSDPAGELDTLLLSWRICPQWEYYTEVHPKGPRYRRALESLFVTTCFQDPDLARQWRTELRAHARVWLVLDEKVAQAFIDDAATRAAVSSHKVGNVWVVKLERRRS